MSYHFGQDDYCQTYLYICVYVNGCENVIFVVWKSRVEFVCVIMVWNVNRILSKLDEWWDLLFHWRQWDLAIYDQLHLSSSFVVGRASLNCFDIWVLAWWSSKMACNTIAYLIWSFQSSTVSLGGSFCSFDVIWRVLRFREMTLPYRRHHNWYKLMCRNSSVLA